MTINGLEKLNEIDFLRTEDLNCGAYFYFLDDSRTIYLKTDNETAVDLACGATVSIYDSDNYNIPVKEISVEINILEILNE